MHIHDVKLFLEVAEQGSLSKVAAQRQTVQSHISRQIKALEKAFGAPVFHRTGRGVVLNEYGYSVAQRLRPWVNETESMVADIQRTATVPMGEVKVGILPSAAHPLMTRVFEQLSRDYPDIVLNVREGQGGELDALLEMGHVDMAILFRHDAPNGQDEVLLATADTYLVTAPGVPLTAQPTVAFKNLQGLNLVLPRRTSDWRSKLNETARQQGFVLIAKLEADSLGLQKASLMSVGTGSPPLYALLGPFSIAQELRDASLQASRIVEPSLQRYVTLAQPKQGQTTPAIRVVAGLIQSIAAAWQGQLNPPY